MADFELIIKNRRSTRKFLSTKVEDSKIEKLVKAALLAPSGKSTYPCEFIVVTNKSVLSALSTAKEHGAALIANAPLAIAVVADTSIYDIWIEDAAIAATFVMLEAENLGLGCCWVQMRQRGTSNGVSATQNMKNLLKLGQTHELLAVLAIGYKAENKAPYADKSLKYHKIHYNSF